jgi:drug/metabolite transporter (DMT)-like permease
MEVYSNQISSSISAILNSLTPLNTLVLGVLFFGFTVKKRQIFGVIIGLIGSSVLILNGAVTHPNQNYYFTILVIIASLCYAINVNLIKKHLSNLTPLSITAGNFVFLRILPSCNSSCNAACYFIYFNFRCNRNWSCQYNFL